jgi:hypothetical protein
MGMNFQPIALKHVAFLFLELPIPDSRRRSVVVSAFGFEPKGRGFKSRRL